MPKLIILASLIFVTSCARNTQSHNSPCNAVPCVPIYGRATDWDTISDDLARNIYRHNRLCQERRRPD